MRGKKHNRLTLCINSNINTKKGKKFSTSKERTSTVIKKIKHDKCNFYTEKSRLEYLVER